MAVFFSNADIDFELKSADLIKKWIFVVVKSYGKQVGRINYLFCSDEYVYEANVRYLNHDTYTDIITFDYVEGNLISGDIMISVDRVEENAKILDTSFESEMHRVIIHGVLHLLGFKDKSDVDAAIMRKKEEESLAVLNTVSLAI
jgi:rRNA maturation RNase YbeY